MHENHGLGIYRGIEKVESDKVVKDYIKIEYRDGGNLYVLATGLDVIQKYASSDAAKKPKAQQTWYTGMDKDKIQGSKRRERSGEGSGGTLCGKAESERVSVRAGYDLAAGV